MPGPAEIGSPAPPQAPELELTVSVVPFQSAELAVTVSIASVALCGNSSPALNAEPL